MNLRLTLGLPGLLIAGWCAVAAPESERIHPPRGEEKPGPDVAEFVHLSPSRPVFVRLHAYIDGKPYQLVWEDFVSQLFQKLDKNKDGVLSKEEFAHMPSPGRLFDLNNIFGGDIAVPFEYVDANGDGKVTRAELAAYVRKDRQSAPLRFEVTQDRREADEMMMMYGGQDTSRSSDEITQALIKLLDTNKDGKLSRGELAAAPEVLRKLDADDDEIITWDEFKAALPYRAPLRPSAPAMMAMMKGAKGPPLEAAPPFVQAEAGTNPGLAKQLLARYGQKGAKGVSRKEIGLDEATFKLLDTDGNGPWMRRSSPTSRSGLPIWS